MNVKETKLMLKHLPISQAILLKGNHGIGKSRVVEQVTDELGISFIDIRLAQNDVGDMKGLPFQGAGRTFFAPPDWFPIKSDDAASLSKSLAGNSKTEFDSAVNEITSGKFGDSGILFLDEINRATKEVQQAAFELVLDRRLNMRDLPDGWRVVAAINDNADIYDVNEMGAALISRFCVIPFKPTVEEWYEWAEKNELHSSVIAFTKKYGTFLDPPDEAIEKATAETERLYDRRAWEMLSNGIKKFQTDHKESKISFDILGNTNETNSFLLLMCQGYLGNICAVKFQKFVELEYKILDAETILNEMSKDTEEHLTKLVKDGKVPEIATYNNQIVDYVKANISEEDGLNDTQSKNLFKYVKLIPDEIVANLWKNLLKECNAIATKWYESKDAITIYIGKVFSATT